MIRTQNLTKCHHCAQPPPQGSKLQRCRGCLSALYCSRDCQKAAWAAHKPSCLFISERVKELAETDYEVLRFGYPSSVAFSRAMGDFAETHKWAIETAADLRVLLTSGVGMDAVRTEPRQIYLIQLFCEPGPQLSRAQRNPATAFKVSGHGLRPLASFVSADDPQSAPALAAFVQSCEGLHARLRAKGTPTYVGVLPVMFDVPGIAAHTSQQLPIYRPAGRAPLDAAAVAALDDLALLCFNSINCGLPLRRVEGSSGEVVPGRMVRSGGKWVWTALFKDWKEYRRDRGLLDGLRTGLSPATLMRIRGDFFTDRAAAAAS